MGRSRPTLRSHRSNRGHRPAINEVLFCFLESELPAFKNQTYSGLVSGVLQFGIRFGLDRIKYTVCLSLTQKGGVSAVSCQMII